MKLASSRRRHFFGGALALACALAGSPAFAAQPLEAFLERAKNQNFDERASAARERERDAESGVAFNALLPKFSARGLYTYNPREVEVPLAGRTLVIQPHHQLDAILSLQVPIIDLVSYYRYQSAAALARASSADRENTSLDVERAVARAYYTFIGASALVRAATTSRDAAQANLDFVTARQSSGAATELDRSRAHANLERAQQELADATLAVELSGRTLETLSGLTPEAAESFPVDDLHPEPPLAYWESLLPDAPSERAMQENVNAAQQARKAAASFLVPSLSGNAQQRFTNATGIGDQSSITTLTLTLEWRLEYGGLPGIDARDAALEGALVQRERVRRARADALFEAARRVDTGLVKSRSARAQAGAASKAAELASERYAAGVATQLDVTQAQRDAFLADAGRIQADADLAYARAALRLSAGRPATFRSTP